MRRRLFLAVLLAALAGDALAAGERKTVLMLLYRGMTDAEKGFIEYLEPRVPVTFILRDAGADRVKIAQFVEEARRTRPDLIYAFGTTVTLDIVGAVGKFDPARHISDIPVVFNIVADPVGAGLAPGWAATGRNLTGVSHLVPMPAQLTTMRRMKTVKRLGVVYNPQESNSVLAVRELRQYAEEFRFELVDTPLSTPVGQKPTRREIVAATQRLLAAAPDFIYLPSDSSLIQQSAAIVGLATSAMVPVISATEAPIRTEGALVGLVSSYYNAGAFAGYKAEQILTGRKSAGTIPIETLQRFTLVVNMNTAGSLGIYPPMDLIPIAELVH